MKACISVSAAEKERDEVEEGGSGYLIDVGFEGECRVKDGTEVMDVRGCVDSGAVNTEGEIVGF